MNFVSGEIAHKKSKPLKRLYGIFLFIAHGLNRGLMIFVNVNG
jgi:hypothetical protein